MKTFKKYTPFFTSALLMCVVLLIIYPHYQYYIDPDGTSYLTISRRYATGDIARAINGYWSPWACWLTAGLMKCGMAAIPASVVVNAAAAVGFLYISQSFFLRFGIVRRLQWLLCGALAVFLCFAIFWQSFDDLWECFFLLAALRVMLGKTFTQKPILWVLYGFLGGLAYYAKAYSFPFFILNTLVCLYFLCKDDKARWLRISLAGIMVMLFVAHFWIVALHTKYGIWTTSTAGPLNTSWYLVGHPFWKEGIGLLLPPAYPDSPYYWEDPYLANGITPHFWSSWHLFGLQFVRIGINIFKFIISNLQLSIFFPLIFVAGLALFYKKSIAIIFARDVKTLVRSFLLFPLGYALVNFESRYLWYMLPIAMVMAGLVIQYFVPKKRRKLIMVLFAVSFVAYPLWGMYKMYDEGKREFELANLLKSNGINGTFTSDAMPGLEAQRMERLAYFSGNAYYAVNHLDTGSLNDEISKYHIDYYIVCLNGDEDYLAYHVPSVRYGGILPKALAEPNVISLFLNRRTRIDVFRLH